MAASIFLSDQELVFLASYARVAATQSRRFAAEAEALSVKRIHEASAETAEAMARMLEQFRTRPPAPV